MIIDVFGFTQHYRNAEGVGGRADVIGLTFVELDVPHLDRGTGAAWGPILVLPLMGGTDMLLGLDFLSQFKCVIDASKRASEGLNCTRLQPLKRRSAMSSSRPLWRVWVLSSLRAHRRHLVVSCGLAFAATIIGAALVSPLRRCRTRQRGNRLREARLHYFVGPR